VRGTEEDCNQVLPEILYEDADLIAVNKPEGIASIPERNREKGSLVELFSERGDSRLFIVHRLDKEVSGLILFAKNPATHRLLNDQFSGREVNKVYRALVHGVIERSGGTVDRPIREFGSGRMGIDEKEGKACQTDFDVVERWPASTLVRAFPRTGRRHQIRVHFYSIGHPIVGDPRYGERKVQQEFARLMLHAEEIAFRTPSGRMLRIQAPLPRTFLEILGSARNPEGKAPGDNLLPILYIA
jgi:tRNA pseudouridine32 synthase/23S rRNA pseudouridine746 synthase